MALRILCGLFGSCFDACAARANQQTLLKAEIGREQRFARPIHTAIVVLLRRAGKVILWYAASELDGLSRGGRWRFAGRVKGAGVCKRL
jgi:hypothetical protein